MFNHPKGLYILFFLEMWERFSYYGMRALLALYISAAVVDGGMGWSNSEALTLYGWYTMAVYVLTIGGGWLADRYLGRKKTVLLGGFLLCLGHILMAIPGSVTFFGALAFIVLGVGSLKGNATALVGDLYKPDDPKREEGFTVYYMGINVGSLLATLSVAYVGEIYGWHYGFGLAGIGMIIGQIIYVSGWKYFKGIQDKPQRANTNRNSKQSLSSQEKLQLKWVFMSLFVIFLFWMGFEQTGGMLTFYTRDHVDRSLFGWEVPTSMFQSINAAFILIFASFVSAFWKKRTQVHGLTKMGIGIIIMGLGYGFMLLSETWVADGLRAPVILLILMYFFHTIGELCLSPVANAFVSKNSPAKVVGVVMGIMFAITGLANKAASEVGKLSETMGYSNVFFFLMIISIIAGCILLYLAPKTKTIEINEQLTIGQ